MNQHRLDYVKAWVEFEIANNAKRWMASPLQDVYAGDIYAPKANGKEDTEAFKDIEYNTDSAGPRPSIKRRGIRRSNMRRTMKETENL